MDKSSNHSIETNKSNQSSTTIILNENRSSDEDKLSLQSLVCRICFDDGRDEAIITPCHCKGTVAYVHKTCLEKWLSESNTTSCELCHHVYETERIPKYTAKRSIWHWIWNQPQNVGFQIRRLRIDLLACTILTPLAIFITYVCLFSADYYNQQKFANIPLAKWTSISLLTMIALVLFGYYLWVYVVIGYHGRTWYYWWQRECVVRYIPPISNSCCQIAPVINQTVVTTQIVDNNESNRGAVVIHVNSFVNNIENPYPQTSSQHSVPQNLDRIEVNEVTKRAQTNITQSSINSFEVRDSSETDNEQINDKSESLNSVVSSNNSMEK